MQRTPVNSRNEESRGFVARIVVGSTWRCVERGEMVLYVDVLIGF